jgi:hypothetical protein
MTKKCLINDLKQTSYQHDDFEDSDIGNGDDEDVNEINYSNNNEHHDSHYQIPSTNNNSSNNGRKKRKKSTNNKHTTTYNAYD